MEEILEEKAKELGVEATWLEKAIWHYRIPTYKTQHGWEIEEQDMADMIVKAPDFLTIVYRDKIDRKPSRVVIYSKKYPPRKIKGKDVTQKKLDRQAKAGDVTYFHTIQPTYK